jgi:hypothetical protein
VTLSRHLPFLMELRTFSALASLHAVDAAFFTILTVGSTLASEAVGISVFIDTPLGVGGGLKGEVLARLFHLFQFL